MIGTNSPSKPRTRAVAALHSLLAQVSAVTLKNLGLGFPVAGSEFSGREIDILAHVEVFGRDHTLACQISAGSGAQHVRATLDELQSHIADLPGKVTPVLILPVLSPEVQALCDENKTSCLDLHGNGRLAVDEIFISMRSLPRRSLRRDATSASAPSALRSPGLPPQEGPAQRALRGFPVVHTGLPERSPRSVRLARTH
jgi:hypothetical protein